MHLSKLVKKKKEVSISIDIKAVEPKQDLRN